MKKFLEKLNKIFSKFLRFFENFEKMFDYI